MPGFEDLYIGCIMYWTYYIVLLGCSEKSQRPAGTTNTKLPWARTVCLMLHYVCYSVTTCGSYLDLTCNANVQL